MRDNLQQLLDELESHRLDVQLVPLNPRLRGFNEGGMKRVCADKNARWYASYCSRHLSSRKRNHRKPDTKIKRRDTIRLLTRLCAGLTSKSKYADELRRIAGKVAA